MLHISNGMKKDKVNIIVAVVIILISFLGVPAEFKNFVYVLGALFILIPSLRDLRKDYKLKIENEVKDTFVESKPPKKIEKSEKSEEPKKTSSHIAHEK